MNRGDDWQDFLCRLSLSKSAILDYDVLDFWKEDFCEFLMLNKIIIEVFPSDTIACDECAEHCLVDLIKREDSLGKMRFLASCEEYGVVEFSPEKLKRWQVDLSKIALIISESLNLNKEPVRKNEKIFYLGTYLFRNRVLDLFFTIFPYEPSVIGELPKDSLIIVPTILHKTEDISDYLLIPLDKISSVEGSSFKIYPKMLHSMLVRHYSIQITKDVDEKYKKIPGLETGYGFRSINYKGEHYKFNDRQAVIIKELLDAYLIGIPSVPFKKLLDLMIPFQIYPDAVSEVFKRHKSWRKIIKSEGGFYWINLD